MNKILIFIILIILIFPELLFSTTTYRISMEFLGWSEDESKVLIKEEREIDGDWSGCFWFVISVDTGKILEEFGFEKGVNKHDNLDQPEKLYKKTKKFMKEYLKKNNFTKYKSAKMNSNGIVMINNKERIYLKRSCREIQPKDRVEITVTILEEIWIEKIKSKKKEMIWSMKKTRKAEYFDESNYKIYEVNWSQKEDKIFVILFSTYEWDFYKERPECADFKMSYRIINWNNKP